MTEEWFWEWCVLQNGHHCTKCLECALQNEELEYTEIDGEHYDE